MKRLATLTAGLILGSPALALAAEHSASYRGIGLIYFTFIAGILIYGVYDAFGKKAMYVATPIILAWSYWMLPPTCRAGPGALKHHGLTAVVSVVPCSSVLFHSHLSRSSPGKPH